MNATQPSEAFTTTTGNSSVFLPLPLTSPAGGRPSGSSRNTPRYQVVAVARLPSDAAGAGTAGAAFVVGLMAFVEAHAVPSTSKAAARGFSVTRDSAAQRPRDAGR